MSLFNGTEKKEAIKRFEAAKDHYEEASKVINQEVVELYTTRKEGAELVKQTEDLLKSVSGINPDFIISVADARASISFFLDSMETEEAALANGSSGKAVGAAALGTAAGAAIATFGASTAMAVVTTFGTAATGTAISALSGAAATNAALAVLGGGALAAGGGGIAAGSAVLAAIPVIGWTIGGAAAVGGGILVAKKNKKCADEANHKASELESSTSSIKAVTYKISACNSKLAKAIKKLGKRVESEEKPSFTDIELIDITRTVDTICELINEKFPLQ